MTYIFYSCDRDEKLHERMCNYERYRCLVHNQFAKSDHTLYIDNNHILIVSELNALNRIELTEKYGEDIHKIDKKQSKKKLIFSIYIYIYKLM